MGKLLIDGEPPLIVQASLALKIGANEAMLLQQVHYWADRSTTTADGHKWVYNTLDEWQKQFPFMSARTVKRTFANLKESGLLVVECLRDNRFDRMPYYRVHYENLANLAQTPVASEHANLAPSADSEHANLAPSNGQIGTEDDAKMEPSEHAKLAPSERANLAPSLYKTETTKDYAETTALDPEVVVAEGSVAPQAAVASNGIQGGLFAEPVKPTAVQVVAKPSASEELFSVAWSIYPERAGSNSQPNALKQWKARVKQGKRPEDMLAGVQRYAAYCDAKGDNGTQYVKMAQTFFGTGLHFEEEWTIPATAQPKSRAQARHDGIDAAAAEFTARMAAKYGATPEVVPGGYQVPNDGRTIDMSME